MDDAPALARLIARARAHVEHSFTWERSFTRLTALYEAAAAGLDRPLPSTKGP